MPYRVNIGFKSAEEKRLAAYLEEENVDLEGELRLKCIILNNLSFLKLLTYLTPWLESKNINIMQKL